MQPVEDFKTPRVIAGKRFVIVAYLAFVVFGLLGIYGVYWIGHMFEPSKAQLAKERAAGRAEVQAKSRFAP